MDLDAHALEVARRDAGEPFAHGRHQAVAPLDQHDPGLVGVDAAVVAVQGPPRELTELSRHLHARRPAPDDHERHEGPARVFVGLGLGQLEGAEDPPAQGQGVVEGLHAVGGPPELVVPVVGGGGAAGDDEAVVLDDLGLPELVGVDRAGRQVDLAHLGQHDAEVAHAAQHVADGRRDLPLGEDAGGHLVEEGLEEVMVGPVDDGDPHRRPLQGPGREEAAEAAPEDDDVVVGLHAAYDRAARTAVPSVAHRRVFTTVST